MKRGMALTLIVGLLGLIAVASVWAGDTEPCAALAPDTRFVDREGNVMAPTQVEAIALQEIDHGTVLVYRRTAADAEVLVQGLKADGESDPVWLAPDTWLVAQAPRQCQMRADKCGGVCPGPQKCRRIRPAVCACQR